MKVLITGFPGSGKSTVADKLKSMGFLAYSTDEIPGVSRFVNQVTKKPVVVPKRASAQWKLKHYWEWNPDKINALLNTPNSIFICGLSSNQSAFYRLFDKIFVLTIDEPTMIKRLAERDTNDFGKHPIELARLLSIRVKVQSDLLKNIKAIPVDSSQPLKKVITEIIKQSK